MLILAWKLWFGMVFHYADLLDTAGWVCLVHDVPWVRLDLIVFDDLWFSVNSVGHVIFCYRFYIGFWF